MNLPIQKKVVYPHAVILLKKILSFLLFFATPATILLWLFCPEEHKFIALASLGACISLFVFYAGLNYTHTKTTIEEAGLLVQKGWIPNKQDSIFWLHIKDVNASAGALESIFRCGTIILKVTIRNYEETVTLDFLPNYQKIFDTIRAKIAEHNKEAKPMTYS